MKNLNFKILIVLSMIVPTVSLAASNLIVNGSIELLGFPRYEIKGTPTNFSAAGFNEAQSAELKAMFSEGFPVVYFDRLDCTSGTFEINTEAIRFVFFPLAKPDYNDGVDHLVNLLKVNCSNN